MAQRQGGDEHVARDATQAYDAQVPRLGALVRDLTDVVRLESGTLTLTWAAMDVVPLVARVVETARDLPPGHTIHLDARTAPLCAWRRRAAGAGAV